MKLKTPQVIGWILSVLLSAFLIFGSGMGKFVEWEGKEKMFGNLGYTTELMTKIGYVEVAVALLYLIPGLDFVGVILLTGYLGGATATHVRVGDLFLFPIVVGVVAWIAYGLRKPEIFSLAMGKRLTASRPSGPDDITS